MYEIMSQKVGAKLLTRYKGTYKEKDNTDEELLLNRMVLLVAERVKYNLNQQKH